MVEELITELIEALRYILDQQDTPWSAAIDDDGVAWKNPLAKPSLGERCVA